MVSWKQCLSDNQAWDTLTWFAALIAMAAFLNKFGFISWFSDKVIFFASLAAHPCWLAVPNLPGKVDFSFLLAGRLLALWAAWA